MLSRRVAPLLALLLISAAQTSEAAFGIPTITPATPAAGEVVSMHIGVGGCDDIDVQPGYPQITRQGNAIRILFWGVRYSDSELCFNPPGTVTQTVGAYPPGSYSLQVDVIYGTIFGIRTDTLGLVPFNVSAAPTAALAAPASGAFGLMLLVAIVGFLGTSNLRRRKSIQADRPWRSWRTHP